MPATLSDKIRNAPKGSRMRAMFDDSTDDESHGEISHADDSQKSQATWVDTQPPPGIQTQPPDHYVIPRKDAHASMKNVDDRCPTPKPKPRQIIIADTPDSVCKTLPITTFVTSTTEAKEATVKDDDLNEMQPHEWHTAACDSPRKSARVSLSPNPIKSRTKVSNHVSSLEALAPPEVPGSRERNEAESRAAKRSVDSSGTESHCISSGRQSESPPRKRKKVKAHAASERVNATLIGNDTPQDIVAVEKPPSTRKQRKPKAEQDENVASRKAAAKKTNKRASAAGDKLPKADPIRDLTFDEVETGPVEKKAKVSPRARNSRANMQESSVVSSVLDQHQTIDENKSRKQAATDTTVQRNLAPVEAGTSCTKKKPKESVPEKKDSSMTESNGTKSLISHKTENMQSENVDKSKNAEPQPPPKKSTTLTALNQTEGKSDLPAQAAAVKKPIKKRTFQDQVVAEMFFSCKAYNLKSLAQSLSTTEIALQYLMLSLLDKKIVVKKDFTSKSGKTKEIYWANQESKAKEVMKLIPDASEMQDARKELASLVSIQSEIGKEMAILTQDLSNEDIDAQLQHMETEVGETRAKLAALRARIKNYQESKRPVRPPGRLQVQPTPAQLAKENCPRRTVLRFNFMRDEWKARKQKCIDFVEQLADGMDKKPKDVIKMLEIETDEMERVTMPPKRAVENFGSSK